MTRSNDSMLHLTRSTRQTPEVAGKQGNASGSIMNCIQKTSIRPMVARPLTSGAGGQKSDGSWDEQFYTGTGFPRVFYLAYHLYRQYFPLIALTTYAKAMAGDITERIVQ